MTVLYPNSCHNEVCNNGLYCIKILKIFSKVKVKVK